MDLKVGDLVYLGGRHNIFVRVDEIGHYLELVSVIIKGNARLVSIFSVRRVYSPILEELYD